ncbi:MAG: lytic transglycosylase domain-containing protein [Acidobacteria bacterium]|nr:lytic transglycosylase domain-containing protein [Acidobacteriota bacterium]
MSSHLNYYYGTLARERMSQPQLISAVASAKESEFLNGIAFPPRGNTTALRPTSSTTARIERARLLRQAGLADLADSELRFGAGTDGQPQLLAIELAHSGTSAFQRLRLMKSVHMDYLAMNVDEVDRRFWEYLFPLPYEGDLVRNARAQGLDPFAVAALVRQESEFNPQALSPARAYGLTQVRPSTGRQLARHFGVRRFSNRMLFQPSTNLKLGTYYIRSLLDNWGGKWELTLASYNAGPGRAKEWVTWHQYREPAEFVETIPFTETREYVQAVLRNAALYRQIYQDRRLRATPEKSVKAAPKKRKSRAGARQRPAPKKKTAKRRR